MGLLSFRDCHRESIRRGIEFLLKTQNDDGAWDEVLITGTGFPMVLYLKYDMYRNNWPLMGLALYHQRIKGQPFSTGATRATRKTGFEPVRAPRASGPG